MKLIGNLLAMLVFFGGSIVHADDRQDVLDFMSTVYTSWEQGDFEGVKSTIAIDDMDYYHSNGNLIEAPDWVAMKLGIETGNRAKIQAYHQNVRIYGNTAVYTAYERVNVTGPDRDPVLETRRNTNVLIKEKGEWKMVHWHGSLLTPVNPE